SLPGCSPGSVAGPRWTRSPAVGWWPALSRGWVTRAVVFDNGRTSRARHGEVSAVVGGHELVYLDPALRAGAR
ncbi:MAG: hypothetical protein ACT4NY_31530, partial [Pseudonocardiales bacterium]